MRFSDQAGVSMWESINRGAVVENVRGTDGAEICKKVFPTVAGKNFGEGSWVKVLEW